MRSNPKLFAKPKLFLALMILLLAGWIMAFTNGASSAPVSLPFSSNYRLVYVQTSHNERYGRVRQVRPADASLTYGLFDNSPLAYVDTPATCTPDEAQASPRGLWLAVQFNCEAQTYTHIIETASGRIWDIGATVGADNIFLGWLPSGDEFVVWTDNFVRTQIYRINVTTGQAEPLALPDGVYQVAFSPDGRQMAYSLSRGLGYGSETWLADADGQSAQLILSEPASITAFIQWSPDGQRLAYIKMPDSVVPFSVGELWLMNSAGSERALLSVADAGHGYRPVWSPDSTQIAYVGRENPDDPTANETPEALVSNIYLVNVTSRVKAPLTAFANALVEQPAWSPDGQQIAFSVRTGGQAGLWVAEVQNGQLHQITPGRNHRFPVWLTESGITATPTAP